MSSSTDAQRLIALSLGKIAMSRQQRGGINLHKNLLVASVLHKARTTYMMDNFHTLLANKRAQAEKEAAAKMIVETPVVAKQAEEKTTTNSSMEVTVQPRGLADCSSTSHNTEVPQGATQATGNSSISDKENMVPVNENKTVENTVCDRTTVDLDKKSCARDNVSNSVPVVSGKVPLSEQSSYVNQLSSCRCVGGKRRRSFATENDSVTEPKKARYEDTRDNFSDYESDYESDSSDYTDTAENMQTESSQVTSLVDIFNTGFNGLCKDTENSQPTGHINVYVSADRSMTGHQYVLKDISCGTQIKDSVAIPTAIALAV